jgi:hypothetical protein
MNELKEIWSLKKSNRQFRFQNHNGGYQRTKMDRNFCTVKITEKHPYDGNRPLS